MDTEKVQELIKKIRIDNNLTQRELAEKYGVTYQAVSKWENGKNLPDVTLLVQMAKDYNIDIKDLLNIDETKKKKHFVFIIIGIILLIGIMLILVLNKNKSFEFKTIEASCKDFKVYGSLAYNNQKSTIYISNVNYCGSESDTSYQELSCSLYEKNGKIIKEISKCSPKNNITLKDYLKDIQFNIENFSKECSTYKKDSLYLEISALEDNKIIKNYKIPLSLSSKCNN